MLSNWHLYKFKLEHLNFHATKIPECELTNIANHSIQFCQLHVRS